MRQIIDSKTIIVRDCNTPCTSMDRSSKQKNQHGNGCFNDILDQMDLTNIFIIFHPKTAEYTFFSSAHECSPE